MTRANLGGLRHSERVFLGLALMNRYKNSRSDSRFPGIFDILDEKAIKEAEVLGKAMRLGAMLWPKADQKIGEFRLFPKKKQLELILSRDAEPLFGEVAQSRLNSLARSLDVEVTVKIKG